MYSVQDDPQGAGFPHSEIRGSKLARNSPRLIAACYVLHRLSVPRHPPNALQRLIAKLSCAGTSPAQSIPQAANRQAIRPAEGGGRGPLVIGGRTQPLHNVKEPAASRPPSDIACATSKSISSDLSSGGLMQRANDGGGERIRTVDLLVANQALSQLSYTPDTVIRYPVSVIRRAILIPDH